MVSILASVPEVGVVDVVVPMTKPLASVLHGYNR